MLLSGKNAMIYGAAGAVGAAIASAFAREGATLVLAGRTEPKLQAVAEQISTTGGTARVRVVDALDKAGIQAHLESCAAEWGPFDLMFNAIDWADTQGEKLTDMNIDRFLNVTRNALTTWFLTGTAMARHMSQNGGGTILGITANAGREPYAMVGGFGVACAAVEHFLRQLAVECGPDNVRVVNVRSAGSPDAPGVREAFMLRAKEQGITLAEFEKNVAKEVPLRHLPSLAEVADVAVIMASDHARAMTATTFNVTCGGQID